MEVLVDDLIMNQQCALTVKVVRRILDSISKDVANSACGDVFRVLCLFWAPQYRKYLDILE